MRIVSWVMMGLSIIAVAILLSWLAEEYAWHTAVAPSSAAVYAIIVFSTLKPRAPKKVVKKP